MLYLCKEQNKVYKIVGCSLVTDASILLYGLWIFHHAQFSHRYLLDVYEFSRRLFKSVVREIIFVRICATMYLLWKHTCVLIKCFIKLS